jgi:hypothetical protein
MTPNSEHQLVVGEDDAKNICIWSIKIHNINDKKHKKTEAEKIGDIREAITQARLEIHSEAEVTVKKDPERAVTIIEIGLR